MRIAGVYPCKISMDPKIQHAVDEPYGLEMILAVARQEGHDAEIFVPAEESGSEVVPVAEQEMIDSIVDYKPDIVGFSLYTCQYPIGKNIARAVKERLPEAKIVAGNRYPSFLGERIEEPFDFFVVKEGEETFRELLRTLQNGHNYDAVKGLVYRRGERSVFTGQRERIMDLDSLPNAARFPVFLKQSYRGISIPPVSSNPNFAIVEYSRCCYNNCNFCDNGGFWGNKVTFRSPERVVDEMAELKESGVDIFYFMDLNFTAVPKRARSLCQTMLKHDLNASWYCMSNTATAEKDEELLALMKEAGCHKIAWGVESTSDRALERMNKRVGDCLTSNDQTCRVLQKSMETGMINQGFYIIGFPWETEESIFSDAASLQYVPLHILNIGIFTPIPLSRFHSDMITQGYVLDSDLKQHDRNNLVYNHRSLTNNTIKNAQEKIYNDFYSSPGYAERLRTTCRIDSRFLRAFNDYFEFIGKEVGI
ncbi:MAG: radical SAM protein [Candidatus Aenigmatarchaeota archaeon]